MKVGEVVIVGIFRLKCEPLFTTLCADVRLTLKDSGHIACKDLAGGKNGNFETRWNHTEY